MENMSENASNSQDKTTLGPTAGGPPPVPQLPPQMFTTAAQLLDFTDKKVSVVLRDGKKFIGVLRSWDQFGNLVIQDTIERYYAYKSCLWAEEPQGIYIVRGENITLIGEIDLDKDDIMPEPWKQASLEEVCALEKQEKEELKAKDKEKKGAMAQLGFEPEHSGDAIL
ncbi:MAG: SM-like, degradation of cytoplasmic mRNAs and positively regulates transcription initiation [Bogoriella megaspora]|nr:MAG: SM-like, degradation of cytoplasmic mRNAs and positively regulates transcription initiation [Bogoriella megaspora]